jgi:hypothetical protein
VLLSPLVTFGLIIFKGLPSFAVGHLLDVFVWVYQVTWIPALLSGLLLWFVLIGLRPWLLFFIEPYDFGRCFSLGAVVGAGVEALSTWGWRAVSHHPFSGFWIAGATISGSVAGAILMPAFLRNYKKLT